MAENSSDTSYIALTASIVSAYVSNNPVPSAEIANLIGQVHSALLRLSGGQVTAPTEPLRPAVPVKRSINSGLFGLPRGRQEIQIAQAPFAHAVQHDAGPIPREVGLAARLSDGRAELCRGPLPARQADGARPAASPPQRRRLTGLYALSSGSGQRCSTPIRRLAKPSRSVMTAIT